MGKKRLLAVREREGESFHERAKEWFLDMDDRKDDYTAIKVRQHYYKTRWAEEIGADPNPGMLVNEDIIKRLMANPQISLEWKLCDPRNQQAIRKPESRKMFLDTLSEEERDIYFNHPEGYQQLENPKSKQVLKATKKVLKIKA